MALNPDAGTTLILNSALIAALIPILTVIGQAYKGPLHVPDDWVPLINGLIGAILAAVYSLNTGQGQTWGTVAFGALSGAIAGFMSGKAYDGAKRVGWIRRAPVVARTASPPDHHRRPSLYGMDPTSASRT